MKYIIYHNPRCSKSRQTLALLQEHGIEPEIIEYLNNPPDPGTLRRILKKLGLQPRELLRTKEKIYKELGLADDSIDDATLLEDREPLVEPGGAEQHRVVRDRQRDPPSDID